MKFIEYARRRRQGYSVNASMRFAQDSDSGDKAIALIAIVVFAWLLADTLSGLI